MTIQWISINNFSGSLPTSIKMPGDINVIRVDGRYQLNEKLGLGLGSSGEFLKLW